MRSCSLVCNIVVLGALIVLGCQDVDTPEPDPPAGPLGTAAAPLIVTFEGPDALGQLSNELSSRAQGVNNVGQIVGSSFGATAGNRAFIWDAVDLIQALPGVLGNTTQADAINDAGVVVGHRSLPSNASAAVFWDQTGIHDVPLPPGPSSDGGNAADINSAGVIVGAVRIGANPLEAFIYDPATMPYLELLGTLGPGLSSQAFAINDLGEIVGSATSSDGLLRAVVFTATGPELLLADDGLSSAAADINDQGDIVGSYISGTTGFPVGFLLSNGVQTDLLVPPFDFNSAATAINDAGVIVGYGINTVTFNDAAWVRDPDSGALTDLSAPDTYAFVNSISDTNQIAGISSDSLDTQRSARWQVTLPAEEVDCEASCQDLAAPLVDQCVALGIAQATCQAQADTYLADVCAGIVCDGAPADCGTSCQDMFTELLDTCLASGGSPAFCAAAIDPLADCDLFCPGAIAGCQDAYTAAYAPLVQGCVDLGYPQAACELNTEISLAESVNFCFATPSECLASCGDFYAGVFQDCLDLGETPPDCASALESVADCGVFCTP